MGLPVMTAAVVVVAIGPIAVALAMRPGDRSSLALIILGAGAVVLGFLVGLSARAQTLVAPSACTRRAWWSQPLPDSCSSGPESLTPSAVGRSASSHLSPILTRITPMRMVPCYLTAPVSSLSCRRIRNRQYARSRKPNASTASKVAEP